MEIRINNKTYKAQEGDMIYDVCKRNGIKIPTLCSTNRHHEGLCRICLVEINLTDKLVPSCAFSVCEKLEVTTESENIKKAREINLELLWSDHAGKCVKCKRNRHCELQNLAEEHKIDNFHFVPRKEDLTSAEELDLLKDNRVRVVVDDKNPVIHRTTEFCVECRRCINICPTKQYGFNHRAGDVVVGTPYEKTLDCIFCGACVKHCPTAALTDQNDLEKIQKKLDDLKVMAVAIIDPAVMESIAVEIPEINTIEKLTGLLRMMSFERVFSLGWGMEKYVNEISRKLRNNNQIILASHCPAFNLYVEKYYPEFTKNISNIKSPDEIMAEFVKTEFAKREKINSENICTISISSCTAKKARESQKLDYILTVRELGRMYRGNKISPSDIKSSNFDKGLEFDDKYLNMIKSGGLENLVGKNKKSVVVNNMEDIKKILDNIKMKKEKYDFIEGMICPGGCVHGGGQSIKV